MIATVIDTDALLRVILASITAGVGVSISFPLVILGVTRYGDERRNGRAIAAGAYLTLAVLSFAGFALGVAYGISVMASK
jgi:hypothetical protein